MEIDTLSQSPSRSSFLAYKTFMDFPLKSLILYCKNNGNLALYYQVLAEINVDSTFSIILGDFNINAIEPKFSDLMTFIRLYENCF